MTSSEIRYVVDTHALLWFFADDPRLSRTADELLTRAQSGEYGVAIPVVVLAESMTIIEKSRSPLMFEAVMQRIRGNPNFVIRYLDHDVFVEMLEMGPGLELHDRAIAATARLYGCSLITRDRQLHSAVNSVW